MCHLVPHAILCARFNGEDEGGGAMLPVYNFSTPSFVISSEESTDTEYRTDLHCINKDMGVGNKAPLLHWDSINQKHYKRK